MKANYNVYNKYRKSKKIKLSYIKKTLTLSIVHSKCGHVYEKIFKEGESIGVLRVLGWIIRKSIREHKIMSEEDISQEFRLKNIDETRYYLIKEVNKNE